jgi:predicted AAA+ superfamily ATPase
MKMSNTNFSSSQANYHQSIPEKVYKILAWLTNPDSKRALILYGPMASGKTVSFWEAIEQLKAMNLRDRPIPKEVHLFTEGQTFMVYNMEEHHHHEHRHNYEENILEQKTIIMLTMNCHPDTSRILF